MNKLFHTFLLISLMLSTFAYAQTTSKAVFAGGCFWCMEPPYDAHQKSSVKAVRSGYTGGTKANPSYEEVSSGLSGHREVIEVEYDSSKISYEKLLQIFWENVDPLDETGQFCDKGDHYKSAIYYNNEAEKIVAETSQKIVQEKLMGKSIKTLILPAKQFYPAEDYHQDYYIKNPIRYKFYRYNCGRDQRLEEVWKKKVKPQ